MKKIELALIGKNISHSQSKSVYENILKQDINYSLIDCFSEKDIPSIDILLKKFHGINITSPYKKYFQDKIYLEKEAKISQSINCIKKNKDGPIGTSTDYHAVLSQLDEILNKYAIVDILILGDGSMSEITQTILDKKNITYKILSRKKRNLRPFDIKNKKKTLIINSCSRDFIFNGNIMNDVVFLDYNYNFSPHKNNLPSKTLEYIDGYHMLKLQAYHSLKFWEII